jgi:hypothetical protein
MTTSPDTGTSDLLSVLEDGVLMLTLNRPEAQRDERAHESGFGRATRLGGTRPLGKVRGIDRRGKRLLRRRRQSGSGDFGGTYFLTQLVGSAKARELYYLCDRVSAEEALRLGIVNWISAPTVRAAAGFRLSGR